MKKKWKARMFQIPALLLFVVVTVLASFYLKIANVPIQDGKPLSWFTPLFLLIIALLYFYGRYLEDKQGHSQ